MKIQKSTANALIVLLTSIFIFKSLEQIPFVMKIITNYPYYTIIAAILIIAYRNKITEKLGMK